ncbi:hypothetical protein VM1G_11412 [Cytospora mali]|uniref:Acyl-CoA thioesterase-like N-terminal HotDog domain-containing protein n=1 Tax=Cytospora mali TaxID=578113 RepID=A0A194VPI2_CYTMA|nr:hypothetical protein VM1G_11412 [Valsa mali]
MPELLNSPSENTSRACTPLAEAIKFERLDSHIYRVNLVVDFCIGAVPDDGYTASCILSAGSLHLTRNQPDAFTAHFEYPGRTVPGAAIISVEDVKLGGQLSTLQLTPWQGSLLFKAPWIDPNVSRRTVLAFNTTLTDQRALSGWEASPAAALPSPLPEFAALKTSQTGDGFWEEQKTPPGGTSRPLHNWRFFLPRSGPLEPGVVDAWICRSNGERVS